MASKTTTELATLIKRLRNEHDHHVSSIEEIDRTLKEFGLDLPGSAKGTKRAKATKAAGGKGKGARAVAGRKVASRKTAMVQKKTTAPAKRRAASLTGNEFILAFVRTRGTATTEDIRKWWEKSGRGGKAENNLTGLVKSGQLNRSKPPGASRSIYSMGTIKSAESASPSA